MPQIYKRPKKKRNNINVEKRQEVYNTSLWRKMRLAKLKDQPLCEVCLIEGKIRLAEHVHHIRSFMQAEDQIERDRLAYDSENLASVCQECHNRIHNGDLRGCESLEAIEKRLAQLKEENKEDNTKE